MPTRKCGPRPSLIAICAAEAAPAPVLPVAVLPVAPPDVLPVPTDVLPVVAPDELAVAPFDALPVESPLAPPDVPLVEAVPDAPPDDPVDAVVCGAPSLFSPHASNEIGASARRLANTGHLRSSNARLRPRPCIPALRSSRIVVPPRCRETRIMLSRPRRTNRHRVSRIFSGPVKAPRGNGLCSCLNCQLSIHSFALTLVIAERSSSGERNGHNHPRAAVAKATALVDAVTRSAERRVDAVRPPAARPSMSCVPWF